ncbi:MAG: hypothetical protein LBL70_01735 [Treponema sp.]|jgi:hypothetical protein|nr:hypothetical protein [Treponema sp.]
MEKPGMGRRYCLIRPGLLGALVFLSLILCPAFSQEPDFADPDYALQYGLSPEPAEFLEDLEVLLEISPAVPEAHTEWVVSLLVNHPNPQDVSVAIPPLPPFLALDRMRTVARQVGQNTADRHEAGERWTAVDLFFVSNRGGPISFAPFEVRIPGRLGYSPPVSIVILGDSGEAVPLRAAWDPFPATLRTGEGAEVRLRLFTGTEGPSLALSYRLEAPVNAIVEALGVEEKPPGELILRFRIIPLDGTVVSLKSAPLKYGNASLIVPGRDFRVLPLSPAPPEAETSAGISAGAETNGAGDALNPGEVPAFPAEPADSRGVFPFFRSAYERALGEARGYWDSGWYAEALVILRQNERDLAAGPALAPLRRAAETALGIGVTGDEKWRPRQLYLVLTAAASFVLLLSLLSIFVTSAGQRKRDKNVTLGPSWSYRFIVIITCIMMGLGLSGIFGGPGRGPAPGKGRSAVLREAAAFRVPEAGDVPDLFFPEGEPVRVHSLSDPWAYVESFEGKAGWVPLDVIIFY